MKQCAPVTLMSGEMGQQTSHGMHGVLTHHYSNIAIVFRAF
jgi:hypothetical protein